MTATTTGCCTPTATIDDIAPLIGQTPLLRIDYLYDGRPRRLYAKYEQVNMTGSVKDRMALHILRAGHESGQFKPRAARRRRAGGCHPLRDPRGVYEEDRSAYAGCGRSPQADPLWASVGRQSCRHARRTRRCCGACRRTSSPRLRACMAPRRADGGRSADGWPAPDNRYPPTSWTTHRFQKAAPHLPGAVCRRCAAHCNTY